MRFLRNPKLLGWLPLACVLLGVGVLGAIRDNRYGGDIVWAGNYQAGLRVARKTHKPVLLCFHAPGCGWCDKLDAETFTDPKVVECAKRYICVRVESDVDTEVVRNYGVTEFPTVLLLDSSGNLQREIKGYIPPDRFADALR
jgi:thioredoxin-related protein